MKSINWILGIFIILLGIVAYEFSIAPMLLLLIAGVIMLPPIAKISDTKFKTKRITRNSIVAILMFIAFYIIGQQEIKKNEDKQEYKIIREDTSAKI